LSFYKSNCIFSSLNKKIIMKRFTVGLFSLLVLTTLHSCRKIIGEGPVVSETRSTREFSEIDFGVPADITYIKSDETEIEIEAQRNIIDVIETYVSGNELNIKVREGRNIHSHEQIRITVKAPSVHGFAVSGSGALQIIGGIEGDNAKLRVSGSGKILADEINASSLEARISGSGSINALDGIADHLDLDISGSGDINLLPVLAKTATTQTSGSGNMHVNVSDDLDVRISGSGDVFYEGNPEVNVSISGSGRLIKAN
jgi:hypothetical protein